MYVMDIYSKGTVPTALKVLTPQQVIDMMDGPLLRRGVVTLPKWARWTSTYMFHVPMEYVHGQDLSQDSANVELIRASHAGRQHNLLFAVNAKGHITYLNEGGQATNLAVRTAFYEVFGNPVK